MLTRPDPDWDEQTRISFIELHAVPAQHLLVVNPLNSRRTTAWLAGIGQQLFDEGYRSLEDVAAQGVPVLLQREPLDEAQAALVEASINAIVAEYGHLTAPQLRDLAMDPATTPELRVELHRWAWKLDHDPARALGEVEQRHQDAAFF